MALESSLTMKVVSNGRWCEDAVQTQFNEQDKAVKLAKLKSMDLRKEYQFLR